MAFFQCNFFSHTLGISTEINVILPQEPRKEGYPTLYLLHGYSDNHTIWERLTAIELYASAYKLAVVMPDVQKSFYNNFYAIENGYRYWDYVSDELLEITRNFFNLSKDRNDTFVAGLSMGGFGALKLGLNMPTKFSHAASLSGAVDLPRLYSPEATERSREFDMLFGEPKNIKRSSNDLFYRASKVVTSPKRPNLFVCCGTEDFLYEDNVRFKNHLESINYDFTYKEGPGVHDWHYWNTMIQEVLEWLPLEKKH